MLYSLKFHLLIFCIVLIQILQGFYCFYRPILFRYNLVNVVRIDDDQLMELPKAALIQFLRSEEEKTSVALSAKDVALSAKDVALSAKDVALSAKDAKDVALSAKDVALAAKDVALAAKDEVIVGKNNQIKDLNAKFLRTYPNITMRAIIEKSEQSVAFKTAKQEFMKGKDDAAKKSLGRQDYWNYFLESTTDIHYILMSQKLKGIGRKNIGLDIVKLYDDISKKIHVPSLDSGVIIPKDEIFDQDMIIAVAMCEVYPVTYHVVSSNADMINILSKPMDEEMEE